MSGVRDRVAALGPQQRAVLARRLRTADDARAGRLVGYVVPRDDGFDAAGLRAFLRERLPEPMVPALFIPLDALPRTPAGKLDVNALPDAAPAATPDTERFVEAAGAVERALAAIWSDVLGGVRVGVHDNFFEIGGDSILSIQVVARAGRAGLRLTADLLFRHPTVAELARAVGSEAPRPAEQATLEGAVPLTPIQHWFFEQPLPAPSHWHHVHLLDAPHDLDRGRLEEALHHLVVHHDALRMRFVATDGAWRQACAGVAAPPPVETVDVGGLSADAAERALLDAAADLAARADLATGPRIAAVLARYAGDVPRLALVVHHLVIDPLSWQIVVEDLDAIYGDLAAGREVALPAKTTSVRAWADALVAKADAPGLRAQAAHWLALPRDAAAVPRDLEGEFTEASARVVTTTLAADETRSLLEDVPGAYGTQTDEVLLAALARAAAPWVEAPRLLVGVERHGREPVADDLDLSRTVGWFTSYFPVALSLDDVSDPGPALKTVKERMRAVPGRGIGYGILRYLCADAVAERLRGAGDPQIVFNYAGRGSTTPAGGARFRTIGVPVASRDPANRRTHAIEINAFVADARLEVRWTYSANLHHRATIERLARRFTSELRVLIGHCTAPGAGGFTPSDFPEASLSQDELDRFLRGLAS